MTATALKKWRQEMNWSQKKLAKLLRVSQITISHWECQEQRIPYMLGILAMLLEYKDNRVLVEKRYFLPED